MPANPISVQRLFSLTAWTSWPALPTGGRLDSLISGAREGLCKRFLTH